MEKTDIKNLIGKNEFASLIDMGFTDIQIISAYKEALIKKKLVLDVLLDKLYFINFFL